MNRAQALAYIAQRGLSPASVSERHCACRRCMEARQQELLEIVQRAISTFSSNVIQIRRGLP